MPGNAESRGEVTTSDRRKEPPFISVNVGRGEFNDINMDGSSVHFSSQSNEWGTPQLFFDALNSEFGFTLDAAATHENAKCDRYFTEEIDGLKQSWQNEVVWCNPPYGRGIGDWIKKSYLESRKSATVVMLIPARTDTRAWHKYIFGIAEVRFVPGRLKFEQMGGAYKWNAPFPCAVVIFKRSVSISSSDFSAV